MVTFTVMWFTLARDIPTRGEVIQQINEIQTQLHRDGDINREDVKVLTNRIDTLSDRIDRLLTVLAGKGKDANHFN